MATGVPLSQYPGSRMHHIHKMSIGCVQVPGVIGARIEEYRWVQRRDPAQLALLGLQIVGHQSGDVGAHAVPNKMQVVRLNATRMPGQVLHQLRDAQASKPGSPVHLAEARLLDRVGIVYNNDVVLAHTEVGLSQIRTGTQGPATAKAMDDYLGGMPRIEVRVVEGVGVQDIYELRLLLGAPRVQVELDLRVRTPVRLLQARFRHIDLCLVLASRHRRGHNSRILGSWGRSTGKNIYKKARYISYINN